MAAYAEDIHALHNRLGSKAATAQLTGIDVPDGQATWVKPGEEYKTSTVFTFGITR